MLPSRVRENAEFLEAAATEAVKSNWPLLVLFIDGNLADAELVLHVAKAADERSTTVDGLWNLGCPFVEAITVAGILSQIYQFQ
jgi:hypothetical protein